MSDELDLVPTRYRERLRIEKALWRTAVVGGIALAATTSVWLATTALVRQNRAALERTDAERSEARLAREHYEALRDREQALAERTRLLAGLRGSVDAEKMFWVIDRALDGRVWFKEWEFRRAGDLVEVEPEAENASYFVIIRPAEADKPAQTWRVQTHMEIQANATDHTALADFVRRLVSQPEVANARVLQTRSEPAAGAEAIHFRLAVVVRSDA